MTKDYAKKKNYHLKNPNISRVFRGIRQKSPYANVKRGKKRWVWAVLGLSFGIMIGLGVLWQWPKFSSSDNLVSYSTNGAPVFEIKPNEKMELPPKPRFDFYTLLPNMTTDHPELPTPPEALQESKSHLAKAASYLIQAGSYRAFSKAEALKATLAFQGIEATLKTVKEKGETWYRVHIGPFTTEAEAASIQQKLAKNLDLDSLILRVDV